MVRRLPHRSAERVSSAFVDGEAERQRFAEHLRAQGEDDATVEAFLRIAERVTSVAGGWKVLPKHVDDAMRRAESEGASAHQLANLKRVGDALVAFAREVPRAATSSAGGVPVTTNSIPLSAEHGGRCTVCSGLLSIDLPAEGGGLAARVGGGIGAVGSFVAVRLFGCFGVLTFLLAGAAVLALYRALTTRPKCTQCGRIAPREELSTALQDDLDGARRKAFLGAGGFALGAGVMFVVWVGIAIALQAP